MGVKMVGDGGAGFGKLGDTLAKALFGDPETEMKMARLRQDYDTEAWRRKVMDAQAANQQSVADKNAWELGLRQRSLSPLEEYQAGLVERPVAPEPPAPVEIPTEPLAVTPELAPVEAAAANRIPPAAYTLSYEPATDPAMAHLVPPAIRPTGEPPAALTGTPKYTTAAGETVPAFPVPVVDPYKDPAITSLATSRERLGERVIPVTPEQQAAYRQTLADQQAAYEREVAARKAQVDQVVAGGGSAAQVAQGLGISEGAVKLESQDPRTAEEGRVLYTGQHAPAGAQGGDLELVQKLRKEFEGSVEYQKWQVANAGFRNMQAAMASLQNMDEKDPRRGPADMRLLYNYLKLLDPNTGVKEGEYSSAREAGGQWSQMWNMYDNLVSGAVLDNPTRAAFMHEGTSIYNIAAEAMRPHIEKLTHEADLYKIDPKRIVSEAAPAPDQGPTPLPPGITEDMINAKIAELAARKRQISRDQAMALLLADRRQTAANSAGGGHR